MPSLPDQMLRRLALAIPVLFIGIFYAYPVGSIVARGLSSASDGRVGAVLSSASFRRVAWFSLWQAIASTALTMIIAFPAAFVVARYRFWGRRLLRAFVVVPFVLPTVVVAGAFEAVFRRFGLAGDTIDLRHSVFAVLLAHVFFNYAVVVRVVGTFWEQLDDRPEQAARVLGATAWGAFRRVTLPRLRSAIGSAAAIVFLFSFTSFGVILILGGPTIATVETEIWRYAVSRSEFDVAATLALIQLVAVLILVVLTTRFDRLRSVDAVVINSGSRRPATTRGRLALGTVIASTIGLLGIPIATLIERSLAVGNGYGLSHYRSLTGPVALLPASPATAVTNSLLYATVAAVIAAVVGTLAALTANEGRRLGSVVDIGLTLPLGTSAVTLGLGILIALDTPPLDFRSRWWIVPVAHSLIGIPFVLRSVLPALRGVGPNLREVARTLGASPTRVRREIDAPLAARAILVGTAFAFAVSLGEFGATSFLPRRASTLTAPVAIFRLLGQPGDLLRGQAMALSVILMLVTAAAALLIERSSKTGGGLL